MISINDIFKIKEHPNTNRYRNIKFQWEKIWKIPEFGILESCNQNPKWHGEGNVKKHVMLVCKYAVEAINNYAIANDLDHGNYNIARNFDEYETCYLKPECFDVAKTLLTAALFHDIGKGVTTKKGKDGNWHSYEHEFEGEKMTRQLLWNFPVKFREDVCSLVRYHMLPLGILDRKNYLEEIIRLSYNIPSWELLIMLKMCDLEGSIQKDESLKERDRKLLNELISITNEINRYKSVKRFTYTPSYFFDRIKGSQHFLDKIYKKPLNVIYLIGIPGAGKDTFIYNELIKPDKEDSKFISLPGIAQINNPTPGIYTVKKSNAFVVCRDDVRVKLGLCKEGEKIVCSRKDEEKVNETIKAEITEAAAEGKTIIVNNTNLKKPYRAELSRYLSNYDIHITYIYIEASDFEKNVERREGQMSREQLLNCIKGFEWPEFDEYDELLFVMS